MYWHNYPSNSSFHRRKRGEQIHLGEAFLAWLAAILHLCSSALWEQPIRHSHWLAKSSVEAHRSRIQYDRTKARWVYLHSSSCVHDTISPAARQSDNHPLRLCARSLGVHSAECAKREPCVSIAGGFPPHSSFLDIPTLLHWFKPTMTDMTGSGLLLVQTLPKLTRIWYPYFQNVQNNENCANYNLVQVILWMW